MELHEANTYAMSHRGNESALVCGADDKFAMPLAITLFSAIVNLNRKLNPHIFILDGGISGKNKMRIEKVLGRARSDISLTWIYYDLANFEAYKRSTVISRAAYLRLLIPELIPETFERAVYLDCDIIVDKDLSLLFQTSFDGKLAMGVQDYATPYVSSDGALDNYKILGLDAETTYCNSGVLVMNLPLWRHEKLSSKILLYLKDNKTQRIDQDGINAIIGGRWKILEPFWNVTLSSLQMFNQSLALKHSYLNVSTELLKKQAFIIHYTSRHKPWHTGHRNGEALNSFYFDQFYRERYFHYLKLSSWFDRVTFNMWVGYRKFVLNVEYKLPRRLRLLTSRKYDQDKLTQRII